MISDWPPVTERPAAERDRNDTERGEWTLLEGSLRQAVEQVPLDRTTSCIDLVNIDHLAKLADLDVQNLRDGISAGDRSYPILSLDLKPATEVQGGHAEVVASQDIFWERHRYDVQLQNPTQQKGVAQDILLCHVQRIQSIVERLITNGEVQEDFSLTHKTCFQAVRKLYYLR